MKRGRWVIGCFYDADGDVALRADFPDREAWAVGNVECRAVESDPAFLGRYAVEFCTVGTRTYHRLMVTAGHD